MQHYKFLFLYSLSVPFLAGFGFDYLLSKLQKNKLKSFILIAVILITTIDLMYFSSYFVTWSKRSGYKPLPNAGVLQVLKKAHENSKEPFRILPFVSHKVEGTVLKPDIAEPNTLMPYEIEEVSGYSSFIPKDLYYLFYYIQLQDKSKLYSGEIFDLFSNFNTPYPISNYHSKILDLLNVKYFIVPNFFTVSSSKLKKIYQNDCALYLNKDSLPRAFVVPNYKVIEDPKETIVYLDSEEFAPRETVILMSKSLVIARSDEVTTKQSRSSPTHAIEIALSSSSPRNDIEFLEYKPENIKLKVQTYNAGFLVLGHNLNNNWKVKVNGKAGKHIQANLVQRAVYLQGPGNYKVEFYYYPKLFLIGGGITLFALFILFVIGLRCYCFTRD
ncbi:MAG: hypothetical protein HYZ79_02500 [Candidatus Melainabacteria bacterium]|nr:hypothetical protein [Candidatus Melainabacteria bacterium]